MSALVAEKIPCNNTNTFATTLKAKRKEIWYADLRGGGVGSEQTGLRPILILQNDVGNRFSPTTIAAMITTSTSKAKLPTHVVLPAHRTGLTYTSIVLLEQIKTLDNFRLLNKIGQLDDELMEEVDKALLVSVGLPHLLKYFD